MKLVLAGVPAATEGCEGVMRTRPTAPVGWVRGALGVAALAVGSAALLSATASASIACSGPVMVVEAIELPVISAKG